MLKPLALSLVLYTGCSFAGEGIPLPFEGLYESRGSLAQELADIGSWRDIPQDVELLIVNDRDITELRLRIVLTAKERENDASNPTIINEMWLVKKSEQPTPDEAGRVYFDVYKMNRLTGQFDDLGDGYCRAYECRYSYVTGHPQGQQRYDTHLTWRAGAEGAEFAQSGSLSRRSTGASQWLVFKRWENSFTLKSNRP